MFSSHMRKGMTALKVLELGKTSSQLIYDSSIITLLLEINQLIRYQNFEFAVPELEELTTDSNFRLFNSIAEELRDVTFDTIFPKLKRLTNTYQSPPYILGPGLHARDTFWKLPISLEEIYLSSMDSDSEFLIMNAPPCCKKIVLTSNNSSETFLNDYTLYFQQAEYTLTYDSVHRW